VCCRDDRAWAVDGHTWVSSGVVLLAHGVIGVILAADPDLAAAMLLRVIGKQPRRLSALGHPVLCRRFPTVTVAANETAPAPTRGTLARTVGSETPQPRHSRRNLTIPLPSPINVRGPEVENDRCHAPGAARGSRKPSCNIN
jgi:hypothetical protein